MPSKAERRQKWNNIGENKVVLHMFRRAKTRPNGSPFVIKLETFLRMANIEYEPDFEEPMGVKNKSPWITFNGEDMADSQFCIEHLSQKLDKDMNKNLNESQKAIARSLRIMLEDHLYWCMMKLIVFQKGKYFKSIISLPVPGFMQGFVFNMMMKNFNKAAHAQGIGRHSREEVEKLATEDLKSLSSYLGNKSYLMGSEPTEIDACAFGFLSMLLAGDPEDDSAVVKTVKEDLANLKDYFERMKEKYWNDWDENLYKEPEKPEKKKKEDEDKKEDGDKKEDAEDKKEDEEKKD